MSQATQLIEENTKVRRRMETLLNLRPEALNEMEYVTGVCWLNEVYGAVSDANTVRARVESSRAFWGWWRNQWRNLDAQLSEGLRVVWVSGRPLLCYTADPQYHCLSFAEAAAVQPWYWQQHTKHMMDKRPDGDVLRAMLAAE